MAAHGYETDFVFTTVTGKFYDFSNIASALSRYYKKIGIEYKRYHVFRHTFTTIIAKNVQIQVAGKLLGHASVTITAKYYVDISDQEKRLAIDSLSSTYKAVSGNNVGTSENTDEVPASPKLLQNKNGYL